MNKIYLNIRLCCLQWQGQAYFKTFFFPAAQLKKSLFHRVIHLRCFYCYIWLFLLKANKNFKFNFLEARIINDISKMFFSKQVWPSLLWLITSIRLLLKKLAVHRKLCTSQCINGKFNGKKSINTGLWPFFFPLKKKYGIMVSKYFLNSDEFVRLKSLVSLRNQIFKTKNNFIFIFFNTSP